MSTGLDKQSLVLGLAESISDGILPEKTELVFVYGSLLSGLGNNRVLGDSLCQGLATIEGYRMVSLGAFPGLVYGDEVSQGELYSVTAGTMARLDMLEGDGEFYTRELTDTALGKAWVYVLPLERYGNHNPVPSGDWKQYKGYVPKENRDVN